MPVDADFSLVAMPYGKCLYVIATEDGCDQDGYERKKSAFASLGSVEVSFGDSSTYQSYFR